jgi:hypothetical protein
MGGGVLCGHNSSAIFIINLNKKPNKGKEINQKKCDLSLVVAPTGLEPVSKV